MKNKLAMAALALAVVTGASGLAAAQDGRSYDRDDNRYYDRDNNFSRGQHVARETGFRDGTDMAREDMRKNKRFNPKPRGRYDDLDHGYRHEFGSKSDYNYRYDEAYREGYASTFRDRGYYR